ncbi:hypothetical protein B566_EDAN004079 [Ephemera danica]|nr:hypothetical protein B566_EDAN004079 [Ephemera danica]
MVGTLKNTRFITVTSTFEKSLATNEPEISPTEPLTENILATSTPSPFEVNQLPADASVATLPAILLASDAETPPLETVTETFNTTQLLLKTHVLPVVQQGSIPTTKMYTLVQSYHVTRFVTAVKTLPPADAFQFLPSRSLNEFNSRLDEAGSELHELELSENDQDGEGEERRLFPPDLMGIADLASIGGDFDVEKLHKQTIAPSVTRSKTEVTSSTAQLSPEQLQQLALLRYLNPLAQVPALTTSKPIIKLETVYESHVIPLWNGLSTVFSTISRPVATISKTEYEIQTVAPSTPPIPGFGPQFTITSSPVVTQTIATRTESKILKLTFGAKTLYSTLYSTQVVPTLLTTYVTTQVPVLPTVPAFPGFFPGGYPHFPYVG